MDRVGGITGDNSSSYIETSFSSCSVAAERASGGLVGYGNGYIGNSYALGDVSAWSDNQGYAGGLLGETAGQNITNCYAVGHVSSDSSDPAHSGGLVGNEYYSGYGDVVSSFWDYQTTGQGSSYQGGAPKSTAEMKDVATFTDLTTEGLDTPWDFVGNPDDDTANDDIWNIDNTRLNGGYPYLSWQCEQTAPDTPQNFSIEISGGNVYLEWDAVTGVSSYKVYSNTDPYGAFNTVEWEGTDTNWSQPAYEQKYYYVTAVN